MTDRISRHVIHTTASDESAIVRRAEWTSTTTSKWAHTTTTHLMIPALPRRVVAPLGARQHWQVREQRQQLEQPAHGKCRRVWRILRPNFDRLSLGELPQSAASFC
jgi:hypothetical protein